MVPAHEDHFCVRWSDMDANRHVKITVFSEFATHTRFRRLELHGLRPGEWWQVSVCLSEASNSA